MEYKITDAEEKLTSKTIKYFDLTPVKLVDNNDTTYYGYLVCRNNNYILLPFNNKFARYSFKLNAIKSITYLTNYVRLSRC